jgi:hypothetical protein
MSCRRPPSAARAAAASAASAVATGPVSASHRSSHRAASRCARAGSLTAASATSSSARSRRSGPISRAASSARNRLPLLMALSNRPAGLPWSPSSGPPSTGAGRLARAYVMLGRAAIPDGRRTTTWVWVVLRLGRSAQAVGPAVGHLGCRAAAWSPPVDTTPRIPGGGRPLPSGAENEQRRQEEEAQQGRPRPSRPAQETARSGGPPRPPLRRRPRYQSDEPSPNSPAAQLAQITTTAGTSDPVGSSASASGGSSDRYARHPMAYSSATAPAFGARHRASLRLARGRRR